MLSLARVMTELTMRTFNCSAILFDLDGVLVDSTGSVTRQWKLWARENNINPEHTAKIAHGVRTIEVVRRLAPHLEAESEVKKIEKREADDHDGVVVMPGAAELIKAVGARGHAGLGLSSAGQRENKIQGIAVAIRQRLDQLRIECRRVVGGFGIK